MRRKKILFISNKATRNGADRILINAVTYLDRNQFEPLVLLNTDGSSREEFKSLASTHLFYLDKPGKFSTLIRYFLPFVYTFFKKRYFHSLLSRFKPDVLYINTISQNVYVQEALQVPVRKVVHLHEIDFSVMIYFPYRWVNQLMQAADHIIACSGAVRDFFLRNFILEENKLSVVYESIDFRRFDGKMPTVTSYMPERRTPDEVWIGASGQPQFRKGTDLFIEIAHLLMTSQLQKKVRFFWIGGSTKLHQDAYMHTMRQLVKRYGLETEVVFMEEKENLDEFYQKIDIYLVTSREDPFPLSMIEAAYYNKKLFGFRVSGVPELLAQTQGTIVDVVSARSMAEALQAYVQAGELFQFDSKAVVSQIVNMEYAIKNIEKVL